MYNFEGTGQLFWPLLLFPSGSDLLAAEVPPGFGPEKIHLYSINVTSHKAVNLGEVSGASFESFDFAWAEPGKTLLFSRTVNGLTNIWNYSLEDRSLTQITFGTGPDFSPMPEPGGKGIYFVNGKSSGSLSAYHVHSKKSTDIVSEDATQPAISSDGKRVMYVKLVAPQRSELWVSGIDSGDKVKIATGESLGTGTWAQDNFQLSFVEGGASAEAVDYIAGADGSGLRQVPQMGRRPNNSVWSPDQKSLYVTTSEPNNTINIWKSDVDNSNPEKLVDSCDANDIDAGGRYLLGTVDSGEKAGIYEVSIAERKCIPLLPGVTPFKATFASDGRAFLYAIASRGEVTIFRQSWSDGKITGIPQVALKVPFAFPLQHATGNAYDFSRDLSTIVYARPNSHADLYLMSSR